MRSYLLLAVCLAVVGADKACCQGKCTVSGDEKYWSIAKGLDGTPHCGESCMGPKKYDLYHLFEWNLTKAQNTETPCKDFGFTEYDSTPTHGFGPISMALDLYNKPPPPINGCCVGKCSKSGEQKYWSVTKGEDGAPICGETCLSSEKYYVVKVTNWNLKWADKDDSPCKGAGYTNYYKTATHKFGPIPKHPIYSVTSDLYQETPPAAAHEFERGVMTALGFVDGENCFDKAHGVSADVWDIGKKLVNGTKLEKAHALVELAEESKRIVETLEQCSSATTDVEKYAKLVKNLKDPRYYTLHNALTLALNVADDRKMLESFVTDLHDKKNFEAGQELILTVLNVIGNPGIPDSNSPAAIQIATGIAEGFGVKIAIKCFDDARVEIPAVIGGVMECLTGVGIIPGLESLFHGLEGLVPTFEHCLQDRTRIMSLLKGFGNFKDPHGLARLVAGNMVKNGVDISIEVAQAALAAKGQEWARLGVNVGEILNEIALNNTQTTFEMVV